MLYSPTDMGNAAILTAPSSPASVHAPRIFLLVLLLGFPQSIHPDGPFIAFFLLLTSLKPVISNAASFFLVFEFLSDFCLLAVTGFCNLLHPTPS